MLNSAILEARTGVAPVIPTLSDIDASNPDFAPRASLFDQLAIANDNPRSLEEELAVRLASAQRELSIVSMYLTHEFRAGCMRQLANLLNYESWDEDDTLLDVQSMRSFARAMAVLQPKNRPMLGLSESGNLLAMWAFGASRLSFESLPYDHIKWFAYSGLGDDRDVAAGTTTVGRISRIIDAHDLSPLLYDQG
jgi:hypothetical protein